MKAFPIALVIVGGAMFLGNPSKDEYAAWIVRQDHDSADPVDRLLGVPLVNAVTVAHNFILFSTFETNAGEPTHLTIGVLNRFVEIRPSVGRRWSAGAPHPTFSHVIAAVEVDRWLPASGYDWVVNPPNGDFRVRWQQGKASSSDARLVAASEEGRWVPADGYKFIAADPNQDPRVRWIPGASSSLHPFIVAASMEGRWLPAPGYTWENNPPIAGNFRVKAVRTAIINNGIGGVTVVPNADDVVPSSSDCRRRMSTSPERAFLFGPICKR